MEHQAIVVNARTRENLMIHEKATGRQFRFGMPGRELTGDEQRRCLNEIFQVDPKPEFIVASGSLPLGTPNDFYARLADLCREQKIHLIVDTSGDPLGKAVEAGVFLIKPNINELTALAGRELKTEADQEDMAESLIDRGCCRYVVVSLGAAGVMAASADGVERVRAPTVSIKSKVGAGDSTVAGITMKLAEGKPFMEAVEYGVVAGAAAVMTPGSELCRKADVEHLIQKKR